MDHSVIFLWVLLSVTGLRTVTTIPPTKNYPCGQDFSDTSRSFSGPYYDGGRNALECLWTIHSNDYLPIKAIIDYIELDCDREYISIYNGEAHRSALLGKICSGSSQTFVSFSGTMSVLLHRDSDFHGPGFFAYYDIGEVESTTVPEFTVPTEETSTAISLSTHTPEPSTSDIPCGGFLTAPSGYIYGPYYPGNGEIMKCIWEIQTSSFNHIEIEFDYVSSDLNCRTGYVEVYDGTLGSRKLGRVCSGSNYVYLSISNTITIVLYRNSYQAGDAFTANYFSFMAVSPTPGPPSETSSETTLHTEIPGTLPDTTLQFQTETESPSPSSPPTSSQSMRTTAQSQESTTGVLPAGWTTEEPTSTHYQELTTGNPAVVETTMEESSTTSTLTAITPETPSTGPTSGLCGGNISYPSGYLSGPFYPGNNISEQCVWEIRVEPFNYIFLHFFKISLVCGTEYVEIIDGNLNSPFVLGKMCSEIYGNYNYTSTSNTMTILLHRDSDLSGYGFDAFYNSVQGDHAVKTTTAAGESIPSTHAVETTSVAEEPTSNSSAVPDTTPTAEMYTSSHGVETTTVAEEPLTSSPSVPGNITDMGYITTPLPGGQCGGNISNPYGYIFGPYYPGNNISEQCVWEITVDPFRYIVLRFYQISLDCSTEYVEIIDGNLNSPFVLGKMCSETYSNYTYTSTSNAMTILLHRDSDLSGNGIVAYYNSVQDPSPQPESTTEMLPTTAFPLQNETTAFIVSNNTSSATVSSRSLSCSGEHMTARIKRTYLRSLGYNAWEVYVNSSDSRCRPQITYEYITFYLPFNGCGTHRQESNNETIIYSNIIKTEAPEHIITRKRNFQFHIMCEMSANTIVETMFVAQNSVDITEKHHGHYEMTLRCYESPSYSHQVYGFPYYVSINQVLYFEVILDNSDPNLILFLDTCKASPYAHDFENLTYPLIEHGCVQDSTFKNLHPPNKNAARFEFNAFKFVDQHNEVFLQCKLVVCMANDYSSRCYQGCLSRKKRNVDEDQDKVDVVLGPFKRQETLHEDNRQELAKNVNPGKDEAFNPLTVATVVLAAMVFVLSGFLLSSKLRRKNYQQIY